MARLSCRGSGVARAPAAVCEGRTRSGPDRVESRRLPPARFSCQGSGFGRRLSRIARGTTVVPPRPDRRSASTDVRSGLVQRTSSWANGPSWGSVAHQSVKRISALIEVRALVAVPHRAELRSGGLPPVIELGARRVGTRLRPPASAGRHLRARGQASAPRAPNLSCEFEVRSSGREAAGQCGRLFAAAARRATDRTRVVTMTSLPTCSSMRKPG